MSLSQRFESEIKFIDDQLLSHFRGSEKYDHPGFQSLFRSINYSLESGGKRFRPLLSVLTAKALNKPVELVVPVMLAVEFIHTYSLIHDDLPCMDNDDERRGQPTNHKVYGEAMALLAGDALLTESFLVLSEGYSEAAAPLGEITALMARAAGAQGMIGGQAMDVAPPQGGQSEKQINWVHQLKTGALIGVSVEAAAVACAASANERQILKLFAKELGFAFQLADDIDDYDPSTPENTSFINVHGIEETKNLLHVTTKKALKAIEGFGEASQPLKYITEFNLNRVQR